MIKFTQQELGRLDILVNNVGIQYVSPVHTFPEDKWDAIIAVCLSSAFHSTKAALPFMLDQKWGRIINTGSMHALVASPYKSAYNAAKHGIAGWTLHCCRPAQNLNAMHVVLWLFPHQNNQLKLHTKDEYYRGNVAVPFSVCFL